MQYETLLTDLADGVMTVTLNRPDKLNAFTTMMSRELIDFFQRANTMDEIRAIVVTGAGRAFCAGADISGGSGAYQVWNDGNKPQKREASDSITLSRTCTSLKSVTSRLTRKLRRSRPRASDPAGKPLRASSTACAS